MDKIINIQHYFSPCGELVLASYADKLCLCDWSDNPCAERNKLRLERYLKTSFKTETSSVLEEAKRQLDEYFAGNRKAFTIPLHLVGTDFQLQVWNELLKIPFGETATYGEIAAALQNPKAYRAVGTAIGDNPVAVLIPCHRVLRTDGTLGGYHWGLEHKVQLLEWEKRHKKAE